MGKRKLRTRKDAGAAPKARATRDRVKAQDTMHRTAGRRGIGFVRRQRAR